MSAAFHFASSQAKLKACWSSSGRTYAAVRAGVWVQASATAIRSPSYSSRMRAPVAVDLVDLGLVPHRLVLGVVLEQRRHVPRAGAVSVSSTFSSRRLLVLEQAVGDVDPEAVDAAVEPEPQHVLEHRAHLGVAPVQVGLGAVEDVEVPVAVVELLPRDPAEHGAPVVRRLLAPAALARAEHVALPLGAAHVGGQRLLEPLVLVGGVVGHQVDDDLEAEGVRLLEQRVGVGEAAEPGVDVDVVGHVVPRVVLRARVERRDPERVDPEVAQVRQPRGDARQVTETVAVGVREGADVHLVDDGVAPPGRRDWIVQRHARHPRHRFVCTPKRRKSHGSADESV